MLKFRQTLYILCLHREKDFMKDYIEIYFSNSLVSLDSTDRSFSGESMITKILKKNNIAQLPKERLMQNISEILDDISQVFELSNNNPTCYVDEIEFGINIGVEGQVCLFSSIGGSASTESSIHIKLKRRDCNER